MSLTHVLFLNNSSGTNSTEADDDFVDFDSCTAYYTAPAILVLVLALVTNLLIFAKNFIQFVKQELYFPKFKFVTFSEWCNLSTVTVVVASTVTNEKRENMNDTEQLTQHQPNSSTVIVSSQPVFDDTNEPFVVHGVILVTRRRKPSALDILNSFRFLTLVWDDKIDRNPFKGWRDSETFAKFEEIVQKVELFLLNLSFPFRLLIEKNESRLFGDPNVSLTAVKKIEGYERGKMFGTLLCAVLLGGLFCTEMKVFKLYSGIDVLVSAPIALAIGFLCVLFNLLVLYSGFSMNRALNLLVGFLIGVSSGVVSSLTVFSHNYASACWSALIVCVVFILQCILADIFLALAILWLLIYAILIALQLLCRDVCLALIFAMLASIALGGLVVVWSFLQLFQFIGLVGTGIYVLFPVLNYYYINVT